MTLSENSHCMAIGRLKDSHKIRQEQLLIYTLSVPRHVAVPLLPKVGEDGIITEE